MQTNFIYNYNFLRTIEELFILYYNLDETNLFRENNLFLVNLFILNINNWLAIIDSIRFFVKYYLFKLNYSHYERATVVERYLGNGSVTWDNCFWYNGNTKLPLLKQNKRWRSRKMCLVWKTRSLFLLSLFLLYFLKGVTANSEGPFIGFEITSGCFQFTFPLLQALHFPLDDQFQPKLKILKDQA